MASGGSVTIVKAASVLGETSCLEILKDANENNMSKRNSLRFNFACALRVRFPIAVRGGKNRCELEGALHEELEAKLTT